MSKGYGRKDGMEREFCGLSISKMLKPPFLGHLGNEKKNCIPIPDEQDKRMTNRL